MKWDAMMDGNFIDQNIVDLDFSGWVGFCYADMFGFFFDKHIWFLINRCACVSNWTKFQFFGEG